MTGLVQGAMSAVLALVLMAGHATGQVTLHVSEPVLVIGTTAEVFYSHPGRPHETVTVLIQTDIGFEEVDIVLDENGEGSVDWEVPEGITSASFSAAEAPPISRPALEPCSKGFAADKVSSFAGIRRRRGMQG